jgi:hypothetical protein
MCSMSAIGPVSDLQFGVANTEMSVIQAPEPEPRIMRYELTDCEWTAIRLNRSDWAPDLTNISWVNPVAT